MASNKSFQDLDLSQEEIKRIETALKDEKFRKMFVEYAEEISDPENRKLREKEIEMMENERGMDVTFVNPEPGHVMKTTIDGKKAFINICTNENIAKPSSKQSVQGSTKGLHWQIPHSFTPPREDCDKKKTKCMVYDVVFHPDTYRMANNPRFRKMVEDTAIDGIEQQFGCKVDRNNIRHPNMKYKGSPVGTVIRKRKEDSTGSTSNGDDSPLKSMPYPYSNKTSEELAKENIEKAQKKAKEKANQEKKTKTNQDKKEDDGYTAPKYTIIHRSDMDLQHFTNAPDSRPSTAPNELEITIELPLCKSAAGVDLDIFEDRLALKSEKPNYKLDLKLPYSVDDENGSAKFDKSKKCLVVTLPVIHGEVPKMPSFIDDADIKACESTAAPLIEVLPPLENLNESEKVADDGLPPLEEINDQQQTESAELMKNIPTPSQKKSYSLPDYEFSQDAETVTFIFHVKNITEESVWKTFPKPGSCQVMFISKGSGGFPMHYSLLMVFGEEHRLVAEHCNVDISEKNMTLTLLKEKSCRTDWDHFHAGLDADSLQEKVFVTPLSLSRKLAELQEQGETMVQHGEHSPEHHPKDIVQVTDLSPKKLTIRIKDPKAKISEEEEEEEEELCAGYESPLSAEIQVVHEKEVPPLVGILKQRSVSESSETSTSGDSPTSSSPRDDKRSVHFNSHVDKATFKSNATVNSMKVVLKSKRRRNKKREEKLEKIHRKRNHSGSSECSSCDEHDMKLSGEDDQEEEQLGGQIDKTGKKVEESGTFDETDELKMEKKKKAEMKKVNEKKSAVVKSEVKQSESVEVDSTASQGPGYQIQSQNGEKKVKMTTSVREQVKSKMAQKKGEEREDSDDDGEEAEVKNAETGGARKKKVDDHKEEMVKTDQKDVSRTKGQESVKFENEGKVDLSEAESGPGAIQDQGAATPEAADRQENTSGTITNGAMKGKKGTKRAKGVKFENDTKTLSENEGKGDEESKKEKGDKSGGENGSKFEVETELSWKDVDRGRENNEHKTACAFKFTNEVMYDLDVD